MSKLIVLLLLTTTIAFPAIAETKCLSAKQIAKLTKEHQLKEKGEMAIGEPDLGGNTDVWDVSYVNEKKKRYLSVKRKDQCFFEPVFLTEQEYESRYAFEGEGECDGC